MFKKTSRTRNQMFLFYKFKLNQLNICWLLNDGLRKSLKKICINISYLQIQV
jgi:hypothetical protein